MKNVVRIAVVGLALASPLLVHAYTVITNAKITKLAPRVAGYTVPTGVKAYFIEIDGSYTNTCGGSTPTSYFGIDNALVDSTQYRDHVATAQLAFALDKTVNIYYDGCIGGFRRIVGLDVF